MPSAVTLIDLPEELCLFIANLLENPQDVLSLSSTCQAMHGYMKGAGMSQPRKELQVVSHGSWDHLQHLASTWGPNFDISGDVYSPFVGSLKHISRLQLHSTIPRFEMPTGDHILRDVTFHECPHLVELAGFEEYSGRIAISNCSHFADLSVLGAATVVHIRNCQNVHHLDFLRSVVDLELVRVPFADLGDLLVKTPHLKRLALRDIRHIVSLGQLGQGTQLRELVLDDCGEMQNPIACFGEALEVLLIHKTNMLFQNQVKLDRVKTVVFKSRPFTFISPAGHVYGLLDFSQVRSLYLQDCVSSL